MKMSTCATLKQEKSSPIREKVLSNRFCFRLYDNTQNISACGSPLAANCSSGNHCIVCHYLKWFEFRGLHGDHLRKVSMLHSVCNRISFSVHVCCFRHLWSCKKGAGVNSNKFKEYATCQSQFFSHHGQADKGTYWPLIMTAVGFLCCYRSLGRFRGRVVHAEGPPWQGICA